MSYAPGTILSSGFGENLEEVIVISENRVATKTFAGKPVARRDIISFSDWQFLVGNQTIQPSYIPLPPADPAADPAAERETERLAAGAKYNTPEKFPIGTKLNIWSADSNQRHVAIELANGVLYVKHINGTEITRPMKKYESYQAWKDALGLSEENMVVNQPEKPVSPIERRKQRCAALLKDGDTPEAVQAIQKLWKVRTYIHYNESLNQQIASYESTVGQLRGQLQMVTLKDDTENPAYRRRLTRRLEKMMKYLAAKKARLTAGKPEEADYRARYMCSPFKEDLYIMTSKGKVQIAYDTVSKAIGARVFVGPQRWEYELKFFPSLEALTKELGGEGKLGVRYRLREIDL
jgi:hypothetical protein